MRNVIEVDGLRTTEIASAIALGKPVTDVIQHLLLTDDVAVRPMHSEENGHIVTRIELQLPRYHFDFTTGKVW